MHTSILPDQDVIAKHPVHYKRIKGGRQYLPFVLCTMLWLNAIEIEIGYLIGFHRVAQELLFISLYICQYGVLVLSKIDNELNFQQAALGVRAQRQQVIAGNIANADTPNYKARDFDFSTALKAAVAGRSGGSLALSTSSPGHISGGFESGPARLMYRVPTQASADGNTVDMDVERSQFSENAVRFQAGLTFISHQIKALTLAVQGQ